MDIHIGVGNTSGSFDVVKSFSQRQPSDTQAVCDLIKNPNDTKQYEPHEVLKSCLPMPIVLRESRGRD